MGDITVSSASNKQLLEELNTRGVKLHTRDDLRHFAANNADVVLAQWLDIQDKIEAAR